MRRVTDARQPHWHKLTLTPDLCFLSKVSWRRKRRRLAALEQFECANDARIESAWRARLFELHLLLPEFDALVRSPPVLAAVEQILGPDLLVWECNIFSRAA